MPQPLAPHDLAGLTPAQLEEWFADTSAVEVTEQIRRTDDPTLLRLMADTAVRDAAVAALLSRFPEFADPERLAAVSGVAHFVLTSGDGETGATGPTETRTARFDRGTVTLVDADDTSAPDVTIEAPLLDFVRLVTGQTSAPLLFLSGRLLVTGDEALALAVGTVFRVPGTDELAVDPSALDADEVATAIARSRIAHLEQVMASGFRAVVLDEVARRFPDFLRAEKAARTRLRIAFKVGGRRDGEHDRFLVAVHEGTCTVERDPDEDSPRDATLTLGGVDFLRLVTGQVNPVTAVLKGTIKVHGDKAKALALNAVMERPKAR